MHTPTLIFGLMPLRKLHNCLVSCNWPAFKCSPQTWAPNACVLAITDVCHTITAQQCGERTFQRNHQKTPIPWHSCPWCKRLTTTVHTVWCLPKTFESLKALVPVQSADLLNPVLVLCSFPLQFFAGLAGLFQFCLIKVATATGSRQVLLQLSNGNSHLLQLGMIFLHTGKRDLRWLDKWSWTQTEI